MNQLSPALGTLKMLGLPQNQAQVTANAPASPGGESGFSLHDLLSVVNPLQHLPVIGTLYRAITGDTIKTPEKIAGDALYGGLWGAVASVADAAFESITGKDVGDTVLAMFTGSGGSDADTIKVAANAPVSTGTPSLNLAMPALPASSAPFKAAAIPGTFANAAPANLIPVNLASAGATPAKPVPAKPATVGAMPAAAMPDANLSALTASLAEKGFDSDLAQRALFAYKKSMSAPGAVLATAH